MPNRPSSPTPALQGDRNAAILSSLDLLRERGMAHRMAEDRQLGGRTITLDGQQVVNFGSCSYLGLETDERLMSSEITTLQEKLAQRIETFDALARAAGLHPRVRAPGPIAFVEIGDEMDAAAAGCALLAAGFFVNVAVFPAVARGRAGLRIVLNCKQTLDDVAGLVRALALLGRPREPAADPSS